jgi:anti-sigma factor RsiW
MNCLAQEALLRYLHGEMSLEEAEASRNHMEQCPNCRQGAGALSSLTSTLTTLAAAEHHALPPDEEEGHVRTWVAYLDNQLPAAEREQVARHVARCEACRDALEAEQRHLDIMRAERRAAPPSVVEHALALGPSYPGREALPWWQQLGEQLQRWAVLLLFPRPQWVVALGGIALAFFLGWGWGDALRRPPTAPIGQTDARPTAVGLGFGTSTSSQTLLTIPSAEISSIEIKSSLRDTLANPAQAKSAQVRIRLTNGILILEEAPQ